MNFWIPSGTSNYMSMGNSTINGCSICVNICLYLHVGMIGLATPPRGEIIVVVCGSTLRSARNVLGFVNLTFDLVSLNVFEPFLVLEQNIDPIYWRIDVIITEIERESERKKTSMFNKLGQENTRSKKRYRIQISTLLYAKILPLYVFTFFVALGAYGLAKQNIEMFFSIKLQAGCRLLCPVYAHFVFKQWDTSFCQVAKLQPLYVLLTSWNIQLIADKF